MAYLYKAQIIDEETDEIITQVDGYSQESLEEEMGKSKWTSAVTIRNAEKKEEKRQQRMSELEVEEGDVLSDENGEYIIVEDEGGDADEGVQFSKKKIYL